MLRLIFIILLTAAGMLSAEASEMTFAPTIDTKYEPDWSSDEGGFWYKVNQIEADIKSSPYLVRDTALNDYVNNMVCRIAGEYCASIRVYIIDNPHFNASMYPNGMMHVWTGLLLRVENEAQLAAVLGHEIAHFLRAHQIEQWRSAQSAAWAAILLDTGIAAVTGVYGVATLAMSGNSAAFSRTHEKEADIMGAELMHKAGYNPTAASELWQRVLEEREQDKSKDSNWSFWASHPPSKERSEYLLSHAHKLKALPKSESQSEPLFKLLSSNYFKLMRNHVDLQEHEQTKILLKRHSSLGYPQEKIDFFFGELYRKRAQDGDTEKALEYYLASIQSPKSPPQAFKHLAYLYLKKKDKEQAKTHFLKYLERAPQAKDKAMIKYYLKSLG
ncbi:hypothetical protein CWB99_21410 [Pseudoalteromonas rubra]|uniref:Peptidase M48 domain-containing protein n=1 Tax=Pseudoalteromonas rubra TaxID=43658 RepID=A0A5S3WG97_9GAMM|nr:M48 family metallopeptidase [Pseudoalteromonas rubra]TMP25127.1 hypothetical protein CWB99_21410 [Pseudoalteromonas rubra]TMP28344.1 hypothetical protein CWC00_21635 [Pseudoalteromonas rubra]